MLFRSLRRGGPRAIKTSHNFEGGDNDSFDNGHKTVPYFLYQDGGFEEGDEVRGGRGTPCLRRPPPKRAAPKRVPERVLARPD